MYKTNDFQAIIERSFGELQLPIEPKRLYEPIKYTLSFGGKRIRPMLCLMSANLFSDIIDKAVKPAIALEIFHNFTLIHDDIMDEAELRRGKPTVYRKWNSNVAILSGDAALIIAYKYLEQIDAAILPTVFKIFNQTALEVCDGQQYDMEFEKLQVVTENDYLKMIALKTSVLLAAACKVGAIIGGAQNKDADLLYSFGKNLGIAFQIQDDFLDTFGDPRIFGKAIGGDIIANKKTFLLINALKMASPAQQAKLQSLLKDESIEASQKIAEVTALYEEIGVKETTEQKINEYITTALDELEKVSVAPERKEELLALTRKLISRDK